MSWYFHSRVIMGVIGVLMALGTIIDVYNSAKFFSTARIEGEPEVTTLTKVLQVNFSYYF